MSNKYTFFKLGIPDFVTIETESEKYVFNDKNKVVSCGNTTVEFVDHDGQEDVLLSSEDAVKYVKLRWEMKLPKKSRFFGDAWERGYGDMEWKGLCTRRFMPWYFLAKYENNVKGFGVKVRPAAMCYWVADPKGITLVLDVRNGGTGVLLQGRTLKVAEIVTI